MALKPPKPIPIVENITKEQFIKEYYKPQKPVIMKGLTKDWPAFKKWNLDYIQQLAGDKEVPLYNNTAAKGNQSSVVPAAKMKLYDYVELLKKGPTDLRIFFYNILNELPALLKDFTYPDIGLKFFKRLPVMFFGGQGSRVLLHYDMDLPNLLHIHFHGTKSVRLYAPSETKYLYKLPFAIHNIESIDMDNPDLEKYPALEYAQSQECIMVHGDALFMPCGYWHYIKYLDGGFSMTLRAYSKNPKIFGGMLYNVLIMRNFENLMRKTRGQKWLDYKERKTIERTNKNIPV